VSTRSWRALTYGVPLAFLGLFFVYPLFAILDRGLRGDGDPPLDVLTDPVTREVVWFTIWQAFASTALTIAVATPTAYVLGRYRFRGRSLVSAIVVVPFAFNPVGRNPTIPWIVVQPAGLDTHNDEDGEFGTPQLADRSTSGWERIVALTLTSTHGIV